MRRDIFSLVTSLQGVVRRKRKVSTLPPHDIFSATDPYNTILAIKPVSSLECAKDCLVEP
jgi:hypothetical protein